MHRFGLTMAISMAALLLAAMGVFAAVGFGCFSLYLYLVNVISPPLAALSSAFAALLFAIAVAWIASLSRQRRRTSDLAAIADALSLGKTMGLEGRAFLTERLSKTSLIAFGLGFLIGLSPRLRKFVGDFLFR